LVKLLLALAILALPAAVLGSETAPPSDRSVELSSTASSFEADDDLMWGPSFRLSNHSALGLYADSMSYDIEILDPGVSPVPRHSRQRIPTATLVKSVSGGDEAQFQLNLIPVAEHARLEVHFYGHHSDGSQAAAQTTIEMLPGATSARSPSEFVVSSGKRVEYAHLAVISDSAAPAVLYIPGDRGDARLALRFANVLAARGYCVVTMSLPGVGLSEGSDDFMGPASVAAAARVLDQIRRMPGVDASRIAVWGVQSGATVAALLAAQQPGLRALVLESGCYDPLACFPWADSPRYVRTSEAGGDHRAEWRARAPALAVNKIRAPTLVVHGGKDAAAPAQQAHTFAAALKAQGTDVTEQTFETMAREISGAATRPALAFLERQFRP
jgi:pimeloyl-ACP methyl ester carboxylesterase